MILSADENVNNESRRIILKNIDKKVDTDIEHIGKGENR